MTLRIVVLVAVFLAIPACGRVDSDADAVAELETRSVLKGAQSAVVEMYLDVGRLPTDREGLGVLLSASSDLAGWSGPYLTLDESRDSWGNRLHYRLSDDGQCFTIVSTGVNGRLESNGDDLALEPFCRIRKEASG